MLAKNRVFQPGAIPHEVIDGAIRSAGTRFDTWCKTNGIHPSTAQNATFGQSGGERGYALRQPARTARNWNAARQAG